MRGAQQPGDSRVVQPRRPGQVTACNRRCGAPGGMQDMAIWLRAHVMALLGCSSLLRRAASLLRLPAEGRRSHSQSAIRQRFIATGHMPGPHCNAPNGQGHCHTHLGPARHRCWPPRCSALAAAAGPRGGDAATLLPATLPLLSQALTGWVLGQRRRGVALAWSGCGSTSAGCARSWGPPSIVVQCSCTQHANCTCCKRLGLGLENPTPTANAAALLAEERSTRRGLWGLGTVSAITAISAPGLACSGRLQRRGA